MSVKPPFVKPDLDLDVLMKMAPPLTVHVSRRRGMNSEGVSLPLRNGAETDGAGWSVAEVKTIADEIATNVPNAAGSTFEIQVRDSTEPEPLSMRFRTTIPNFYEDAMKQQTPFNPYPGQYTIPQPGVGGWGPGVNAAGQVILGPQWGAAQAPRYGTPIPSFGGPGTTPSTADEVTRLREELHRRDIAAMTERSQRDIADVVRTTSRDPNADHRLEAEREARLRAERDAAEQRHKADLAMMEAKIAALAAAAATPAKSANDDAVARMERMLAEQAASHRAEMDRMKFEQAQATMLAKIEALTTAKPAIDPMMMFMTEMMKSQASANEAQAKASTESARYKAEADRDIAKANVEVEKARSEAMSKILTEFRTAAAATALGPMDMMKLMKDNSSGTDDILRSAVKAMTDIGGLYQSAALAATQMQPPGEGPIGRIVDAASNAVDTWAKTQAQTEAAKANSTAQIARAQADVETARMNAMSGWAPPPQVVHQQGGNGLSGPSGPIVPPNAGPPAPEQLPAGGTPTPAPASANKDEPTVHGRTDDEWFGPALDDVKRLRTGAIDYLTAVKQILAGEGERLGYDLDEPNMEPVTIVNGRDRKKPAIGLSPYNAAKMVILATSIIEQRRPEGMVVPAYEQLYKEQMYPAFMEALLPDPIPAAYRIDVIRFLDRQLRGAPSGGEKDAPMFGVAEIMQALAEEEEAEEGKGDDAAVAAAAAPNGATRAAQA